MTKPQQLSFGKFFAMLMIGFGFLSIGIMFFLLKYQPADPSVQDFSAVPSKVNFEAPELHLVDLDGREVSFADHDGNVILVNLWATWCPPCREEMPTLQAFYEEYKSMGFILVAIDQGETLEEVRQFQHEFGLTFPIWLDPDSVAGSEFNTMNLPSSYVIDRDGKVRLMWIGGISKKNLEAYVSKIILE